MITFDSKNGAKAVSRTTSVPLGLQAETLDGIPIFVVPSPSGLARRFFGIDPSQNPAACVEDLRHARAGRAPE